MTEQMIRLQIAVVLYKLEKVLNVKADKKWISVNDSQLQHTICYADRVTDLINHRTGNDRGKAYDKTARLSSIFNILNGNQEQKYFKRQTLTDATGINYPQDGASDSDKSFWTKFQAELTKKLSGLEYTEAYLNSLMALLENWLTYVPADTSSKEQMDISLYDHLKMTAAIAACTQRYLQEEGCTDYQKRLLSGECILDEEMFLLYSMDVSGIQKFIYNIASKGALKALRARSFYLEIAMEHIIDELLDALGLGRANLIYSGGGHCYLLFPNLESVKQLAAEQEKNVNQWFLKHFDTSLYIAAGMAPCSAYTLGNQPYGSYSNLYMTVSREISEKKTHRYGAEEILLLNSKKRNGDRECSVCRTTGTVDEKGHCPICAALEEAAKDILECSYFVVREEAHGKALPLPGGFYLSFLDRTAAAHLIKNDRCRRCYSKNTANSDIHTATRLWVGDYKNGDNFDALEASAEGIKRLAVLRADVDNLGQTFVFGFRKKNGDDRAITLTRTASLSRQLSLFFKYYINDILANGIYDVLGNCGRRHAVIVYSGGDDLFLVGAWNDVVAAFVDLRNALMRFSQNTLTISGGIGMYQSGYPISVMAQEVAELEDLSKSLAHKNGITLFSNTRSDKKNLSDPDIGKEGSFDWMEFTDRVMGEKFHQIHSFFVANGGFGQYGKAFLYRLLELIRGADQKINLARFAYLLSRMEPSDKKDRQLKQAYDQFAKNLHQWIKDPKDRKELIMAIYLNIYLMRTEEEEHGV